MYKIDISVIIPSYKPESYIEDCLKSLSQQTLHPSRFEILIVLNGCKEPWLSFITGLIERFLKDFHVNLIQTDNPGVSNARNIALNVAQGEYITFIDDDDFISQNYLEELLNNSSKECVGLTDSIYYNDKTLNLNYDNIQHRSYLKLKKLDSPSIYKSRSFFNGPCMKLIHRDIIGESRFDDRFRIGEDSLFMALISDRIKECAFCSDNAIYYRRIRIGSASNSKVCFYKFMINNFKCIVQYIKYWIGNPFKYNVMFMSSRILATMKNIVLYYI